MKNSQVEAALGDYGVVHPRSTRVRLVIMAILMDENYKEIILQNVSDPIACNQISSEPVILKTSIDRDNAFGGSELWIIGKSLSKSGPLPVGFRFASGSLPVHFRSNSGPNPVKFRKCADGC